MDDRELSRISGLIKSDIRVQVGASDVAAEENKRDSLLRFAKYLVSVSTHSTGTAASVRPYNTRQSHVLLYIMEVFKVSESDLRDMFTMAATPSPTAGASQKQKHLFRCRKFHSWRPEVVLRMSRPRQLNQIQLDNLSVRVYLFKEESGPKLDASDLGKFSSKTEKSKHLLDMIFSKSRLHPSVLIRPVNELRSIIRFKSTLVNTNTASNKLSLSSGLDLIKRTTMVCSYRNLTIFSDLRLHIRRYYCDPKVPYILRFEFWIDNRGTSRGIARCIRSTFRGAVYNGVCSCLRKKESIYRNEHSDFYGFINLRLAQLPAYPCRLRCDILSLQEKGVDSCEVICDIRNRQVSSSCELNIIYPDKQVRKSNRDFFMKHIRLYVNCLLYHCASLSLSTVQPPIQEVTLDSLFYLPAHSLVNQHRLQGNLSQFEERCLRRISILLLLINLHDSKLPEQVNAQLICRYLIAIAQNEYLMALRPLDDKTGQDLYLFERTSTAKPSRGMDIIGTEVMILDNYMSKFLNPRIGSWLAQPRNHQGETERSLTLSGMRLLQSALGHLRRCRGTGNGSHLVTIKQMKREFEAQLCFEILERLSGRLQEAVRAEVAQRKRRQHESLWLQLLLEVKFMDHDLCLNWSRKGLEGVFSRELSSVETARFQKSLRSVRGVVEAKLDEYLSEAA